MADKNFKILSDSLLHDFLRSVDFDLEETLASIESDSVPVDYFKFYNSVSSVYSSKMEGGGVIIANYKRAGKVRTDTIGA